VHEQTNMSIKQFLQDMHVAVSQSSESTDGVKSEIINQQPLLTASVTSDHRREKVKLIQYLKKEDCW